MERYSEGRQEESGKEQLENYDYFWKMAGGMLLVFGAALVIGIFLQYAHFVIEIVSTESGMPYPNKFLASLSAFTNMDGFILVFAGVVMLLLGVHILNKPSLNWLLKIVVCFAGLNFLCYLAQAIAVYYHEYPPVGVIDLGVRNPVIPSIISLVFALAFLFLVILEVPRARAYAVQAGRIWLGR